MEDAPEDDRDIKLQKASSELIADFERSLVPFLRKPDGQLRTRVRISETARLTSTLLDPFQELPQLLDPHLPRWLPLLAASYLENLYTQAGRLTKPSSTVPTARAQLLEPLPAAIARLLYTFAKIRGPSVVVRFLPVEARHLEPLLSALESAERRAARPSLLALTDSARAHAAATEPSQRDWIWEERYLVLLWLSQLLLAPFDLSTISSADPADDGTLLPLPDFAWPSGLPAITTRVLPLAIKYLASPGKERDGARDLLVRLSMRRDMQSLGVLDALVRWALASLRTQDKTPDDAPERQPYFYIGVLSFLAGALRSSVNTSDMDAFLPAIFAVAHAVSESDSPVAESIRAYAVARKMVIKVIRSIAVLLLRHADHPSTDLVETSIGYLLDRLADNDTPVRLAASKALSVITLKLDPDMADEVVDAVLDALNRNVLWAKSPVAGAAPTRDLAAVDPLEWHGLTLTLSHLLYRRSPPARQLPAIIAGLLLALAFEKRSTSGGSIGTNVRDAACFGIWALARRYTTAELLAVPTDGDHASPPSSVLQRLATELTVTASLDAAGNIRRGASAALQELIGRHPDTVDRGIWLVQTVDYHAVALRSRALREGALKAAKLSPQYGRALLAGLLGWRGVGDPDAAARRVASASFGTLTLELSQAADGQEQEGRFGQFQASAEMVLARLRGLQNRQVEERHGLLLCLAAVLDKLPHLAAAETEAGVRLAPHAASIVQRIIRELADILQTFNNTTYRRPELIAEAANRLIIASLPVMQAASVDAAEPAPEFKKLLPGFEVVSPDSTESLLDIVGTIESLPCIPDNVKDLVRQFEPTISTGLNRPEKEAVAAASEAALILLAFSTRAERERIVKQWADTVRYKPTSRTAQGHGYFAALTMAHPVTTVGQILDNPADDVTTSAILSRWAGDNDIETRVAILQSLTHSVVLRDRPLAFLDLLAEGLNDYTTNARGDVGSHVRLGALRATKCIWRSLESASSARQRDGLKAAVSKLYLHVLRLAAEKLDRVRTEAHAVLALTLAPSYALRFNKLTFSSRTYLYTLLTLSTQGDHLHPLILELARADPGAWMAELLAGYVTSADTGNEDLVIASRAALTEFCSIASANRDGVCAALMHNLSARQGQDRVLVPTLEIVAFLYRAGLFAGSRGIDPKRLCLLVQKAGYKTGSIRKLEACIRVYGCVALFDHQAEAGEAAELAGERGAGTQEARKRLGALMFHPWPRVRSLVVDELWRLFCDEEAGAKLKGVDWGRADKGAIRSVVSELGLS